MDSEDKINMDIIRIPLLEGYYKLTQKSVMTFRDISKINGSFQYVLKIDDDFFPNMRKMLDITLKPINGTALIGRLLSESPVMRDKDHKWCVTFLDNPKSTYDNYILGASYLIRKNVLGTFEKVDLKAKLFPFEDFFVSSHVVKEGYKLGNDDHFLVCYSTLFCSESYIFVLEDYIKYRKLTLSFINRFLF